MANGTLAPTPGSPYTLAVNAPITATPLSLAYIAPFLVAANSDPDSKTGMTVFKVNQQTGALTHVPQPGPQTTFVDWEIVVADPLKHLVFAMGEDNSAAQQNGLATFRLTSTGIMQRIGVPIQKGPPVGSIALDPFGRFLYLLSDSQVFVWKRNAGGTLGAQVSGSPFKVGVPPIFTDPSTPDPCLFASEDATIASHPNGHFIYTACNRGQQVTVSAVSSSGRITPAGAVLLHNGFDRVSSLSVNHAGTILYGTEERRNAVLTFAIVANGKLTLRGNNAAGLRPNSVAADPQQKHLFVTNGSSNIFKGNFVPGSNNLSYYSLQGTVATQSKASPVSTGGSPRSVTVVIGH